MLLQDTKMSFRINSSLRKQFAQAADLTGRPAADIMRKLMQDFITSVNANTAEEGPRRMAVDFAIANNELEGFTTSPDFQALLEQFAQGKISTDDIRRDTELKLQQGLFAQ